MQCTFDKNRAAVNLFATAPDWGAGTYTNHLTNPSFEAISGTVEVYRNLVTHPRFGSNWSFGWGGGSWTASSPMTEVDPVTGQTFYFVRLTCTTPSTLLYTHTISGLTDGATYSGALELRPSANIANIGISFTGGVASRAAGLAGVWSRHEVSKVVSGTTQTINYSVETSPTAGFYVDVRFPLFVAGAKAPAYFDGSFSPDSDLTAAWTGTANASASTLTGSKAANVADMAFDQGLHYLSGTAGSRSLCVRVAMGGPVGIPVGNVLPVTGATRTLVMRVKALTRNTIVTPRIRNANTSTVTLPKGEWITIIATGSAGSGSAVQTGLLLGTGAGHQTGDLIQIDWALLVQGTLPEGVMYWDGANKPASIPGATVAWTGNPNASTSTLTIPAITSARIERLTNNTWETIRGGTPPSTGYVALADQEMPLNQIVRYRISGFSGEALVRRYELEVDTTLEGSCTFIKVAGKPNLSTCFDVPRDRYEMSSATQGGTYDVLGGGSIGISSAAGIAATRMTIQAVAKTDEAAHALEVLLESHRIVFLQPVGHRAYPEGWYYIESVSWGMRADGQKKEGRSFVFPVVRTSRPGGESAGVAGSSYRLSQSKYPTYADIPDELSYFELLQGA